MWVNNYNMNKNNNLMGRAKSNGKVARSPDQLPKTQTSSQQRQFLGKV